MPATQNTVNPVKGGDAENANNRTTGFSYVSSVDSLVALAGGAQAGTALTAQVNRVITVASAADSVQLPVSEAGLWLTVINAAAANSMNVFPKTGESINALANNAAFAVAAGKTCDFYCTTAGKWHSLLSA